MSDLYRLVIKDGGVQWTPEEVIGDLIDEGVLVPVEPDIDAAKAESDRQQGGPGLSRHKIAKIVNAAYAGIGADDE